MVVTYLQLKLESSKITTICQILSRNHNTILVEIEFLKGKIITLIYNTCSEILGITPHHVHAMATW